MNWNIANKTVINGPVITSSNLQEIGNAIIVAPHPDDESLACGATIGLLRKNGFAVKVIFITDGTMSHPNSKSFPSESLRRLREQEGKKALAILNVNPDEVHFMCLPDSKVGSLSAANLSKASKILEDYIIGFRPKTIFLPWRKDPHPDHIASWHLSQHAMNEVYNDFNFQARVLEYPVWFLERGTDELAQENSITLWKVKTSETLLDKKKAIGAHASQLGLIIHDDPQGFALSNEMLEKFYQPEEPFFEYCNVSTSVL